MQSYLYNITFILTLNVSLFIFYLIRQKLSKSITKKIKLIFKIQRFTFLNVPAYLHKQKYLNH